MADLALLPTTDLDEVRIQAIREFLADRPLFRLYFEAALDACEKNRSVLIAADGRGLVLSIDFEAVTVRTTIGTLSPPELATAIRTSRRAELHLEAEHLEVARPLLVGRIEAIEDLIYYRLDAPSDAGVDRRCRLLGPGDLERVAAFYREHYRQTVFSAWMLAQPFVGLFEDGRLLACGGVIAWNRALGMANLGNFLTHPDWRGRGLARAVARTLIAHLEGLGIRVFLLGTVASNLAARRVYESLGFRLNDARPQVDVAGERAMSPPPANSPTL